MFRKIVTELAYSPALAGNIGYYVKQLRDDTSRRQIGLIFVVLAITVQLLTTMLPPESANANNPAIFIDGGVQSIDEYLGHYDQNTGNTKDLLTSLGITRPEIEAAQLGNLPSSPQVSFWSMQNSRQETDGSHSFRTVDGKLSIAHYQLVDSGNIASRAYIGSTSVLGGWFAITKNGANLLTENPAPSQCAQWLSSPTNPLPVDSWSDNPECLSKVGLSLSARAISSSSPVIDEVNASSRIAYTLSAKNNLDATVTIAPAINLEDILEYSRILDYGGGTYDFDTRNLSWPEATVAANGSLERTFIIQALPTIPSTARGEYVTASYDCSVTASFGSTLSLPINCPPAKRIEQITNNLPRLSEKVSTITALGLLIVTLFLYARSRQLLTELYIIRHNHLGGL